MLEFHKKFLLGCPSGRHNGWLLSSLPFPIVSTTRGLGLVVNIIVFEYAPPEFELSCYNLFYFVFFNWEESVIGLLKIFEVKMLKK